MMTARTCEGADLDVRHVAERCCYWSHTTTPGPQGARGVCVTRPPVTAVGPCSCGRYWLVWERPLFGDTIEEPTP